jgi:3-oxoadipate CoA-transferase, beta subunit
VSTFRRLERAEIAWRAAQDLRDGQYVNLGVGLPSQVAAFVPRDREIIFQSENGVLGVGPRPGPDAADPELIDASTRPVTVLPGACFFHCADSFVMLRGGHVDLALLGAFQVSCRGDLASWSMDRKDAPPAVGGAMDIAVGTRAIWVLMEHCTKTGEPRLVRRCSFPLTAPRVVKRIYTDLAILDVPPDGDAGFVVRESVPNLSLATLRAHTGAELLVSQDWRPLVVPQRQERQACP